MKFLYIIAVLSTNILYTLGSEEDEVDEDVQNWLDRIDEFGQDWEKKTDESQPEFTNEWKATVEKRLEEIRQVVEDMKSKGESFVTEASNKQTQNTKGEKSWMAIIKEKLESIQNFGISWKNKISEKFRSKFKRDWNKHVQNSINKLKEVDTTAPSKVKSMWDKIRNYGIETFGGNRLERLKMTRTFPLPLDLEGVKVKYHKSNICVTQKGKEKCASKNEKPGQNSDVEKLFRVVHEYENLNKRDGGGGGSDDGGGDGDDEGERVDKSDKNGKSDKADKGVKDAKGDKDDKDDGGDRDDEGDKDDEGDGSDGNGADDNDGRSNEYKKDDKSDTDNEDK